MTQSIADVDSYLTTGPMASAICSAPTAGIGSVTLLEDQEFGALISIGGRL